VKECTCCYCWVNDVESKPHLNDDVVSTGGQYKRIEIGYVPVNKWNFVYGKYLARVEQMNLSRNAYEFWKIIRDQKDGVTNLFQPAYGRISSNLHSLTGKTNVTGVFYASSITEKTVFITSTDFPLSIPQPDIQPPESNCSLWNACDVIFSNASRTPPPEWD